MKQIVIAIKNLRSFTWKRFLMANHGRIIQHILFPADIAHNTLKPKCLQDLRQGELKADTTLERPTDFGMGTNGDIN